MDAVRLSEAQWRLLEAGFRGPRPGSNALTLLGLTDGVATVTGAEIGALMQAGYLDVRHVFGKVEVLPGSGGSEDEIPEVEMTHNYQLSASGRHARRRAVSRN